MLRISRMLVLVTVMISAVVLVEAYGYLNMKILNDVLTEENSELKQRYASVENDYSRLQRQLHELENIHQFLQKQYYAHGIPVHRSVSVLDFREYGKALGNLTSVFSISDVNEDTANVVLTLSFTSSNESILDGIGFRMILLVDMFNCYPPPTIPLPPPSEYSLRSGELIVLADKTFNLSRYDVPGVAIACEIDPIELRFPNGSTLQLESFSEGRCTVTPQATLTTANHVMRGIAPLWEGDYEHSPSLILFPLEELKGRHLWRKIIIDIDYGNYTVEKMEGKL